MTTDCHTFSWGHTRRAIIQASHSRAPHADCSPNAAAMTRRADMQVTANQNCSSSKAHRLVVSRLLRVTGRCQVEAEACSLQGVPVLLQPLQVLLQRGRIPLQALLWRLLQNMSRRQEAIGFLLQWLDAERTATHDAKPLHTLVSQLSDTDNVPHAISTAIRCLWSAAAAV
jgi:hypothetical protein